MKKQFNLICIAPDGEFVTEKRGFESVEEAWHHSCYMGSRWFFYPILVVTAGTSNVVRGVSPDMNPWVREGQKLSTLLRHIKKNETEICRWIEGKAPFPSNSC